MTGCLLALFIETKAWLRIKHISLHTGSLVCALAFLLGVDSYARERWRGMYLMTVGFSLEAVAISIVVLYSIFSHESLWGKFLNLKPLTHLGIISYSLYLWQQLFTRSNTHLFPMNILWILLCAEASYLLVERPSFYFRTALQEKLFINSAPKALIAKA
jgi:peptidoglycan/LPS O-acetylase OafA/YrhL